MTAKPALSAPILCSVQLPILIAKNLILVLVVREEEELHDHVNITCPMCPDVCRFITKSGQKLLANEARDAGESPHRFFQNMEDRE
jgi:hypothetical protein